MTPRLPPHSIEAEQSVLGGLLLDNAAWDRMGDVLVVDEFYRDDHRRIYRHIAQLIEAGKPADAVTVAESIESSEDKDKAGGLTYLGQLAQNVPSAHNIRRYAEIVREHAELRRIAAIGAELHEDALEHGAKPQLLAERAYTALVAVHAHDQDGPVGIDVAVDEALIERESPRRRLATGISNIDFRLTHGGMRPGSLNVVAGRPGRGKTALIMQIALNAALASVPSLVFSMEMTRRELAERLLTCSAFDPAEVACLPISIDDTGALHLHQLRARTFAKKRRDGIGLLVIDYLQLLRVTRPESRFQEVSEVSRTLKALAKDLDLVVLAAAQLSRASEYRQDKRPTLADLRESGQIEQDADLVIALHGTDDPASVDYGLAEALILKQRNGPVGRTVLRFDGARHRFEDYSGPLPSPVDDGPRATGPMRISVPRFDAKSASTGHQWGHNA